MNKSRTYLSLMLALLMMLGMTSALAVPTRT